MGSTFAVVSVCGVGRQVRARVTHGSSEVGAHGENMGDEHGEWTGARGIELCDAGEERRSGGGCAEVGVSGFPGVPGRTLTGSDEVIGAAGATGTGAGAAAGAGAEGTGKPAGAAPPNKAGAADIACIACIIAGFDMRAASAAGFAIVACMAAGANAAGFAMAANNACCCACCVCKAVSATTGSIA